MNSRKHRELRDQGAKSRSGEEMMERVAETPLEQVSNEQYQPKE